jgi:hypothetical protein
MITLPNNYVYCPQHGLRKAEEDQPTPEYPITPEQRNEILKLWQSKQLFTATTIALEVGVKDRHAVLAVIKSARRKGDPRALRGTNGSREKHPAAQAAARKQA